MANEIGDFVARELLGTDDPMDSLRAMLTNPGELAQIMFSQLFLKRVHWLEERCDVSVIATLDRILTFRARYAANEDGTVVLAVDRHDTRAADELYEIFEKFWLEVTLLRKGTRQVLMKIGFKNVWIHEKDLVSRYAVYTGSYDRAHVLMQNVGALKAL